MNFAIVSSLIFYYKRIEIDFVEAVIKIIARIGAGFRTLSANAGGTHTDFYCALTFRKVAINFNKNHHPRY